MAPSTAQGRRHPTYATSYHDRSLLAGTPPLAAYLFRLMAAKKTNLCLSADVQTTSQLLQLAEECGDSICALKTHADIIKDFGERTIKGLQEVAARKRFVIFEDRKFGDIGNTLQMQYAAGPHRIASWSHITNAHIFPGPAVITALKQAASDALTAYNTCISTEISGGDVPDGYVESSLEESDGDVIEDDSEDDYDTDGSDRGYPSRGRLVDQRKGSIVSISTTISSSTEYRSPPPYQPMFNERWSDTDSALHTPTLEPPPIARGLLLLAQMSSADNLFDANYTAKCAEMARAHKDFVLGFIAQEGLNRDRDDNFLVMTPGVNLPPADVGAGAGAGSAQGDGLGQQYNTPRRVVLERGADIVIVGRGILNADDRWEEAERYRADAWAAYLERTGKRGAARK